MIVVCAQCGNKVNKTPGAVNRAKSAGLLLFCNLVCAGLSHRKNIAPEKKKEAKRIYDANRRLELKDTLKAKKAAYHKRTYDPARAAVARKKTMQRHVEYCRRPEYKEWKREYDSRLRAKEYGEFAEAFQVLLEIEKEIASRATRYEIYAANGTLNKSLTRKREYERLICNKS